MALKERLDNDLKEAQKAKDKIKLNVIRMLKTVIKNREVEKRGELTEEELIQAVNSQVKSRKEAILEYEKAGRIELAKKEEEELSILNGYLPEQLTDEALEKLIDTTLQESDVKGPKDMGKVMKVLMPQITGRADGKKVSQIVKEKLSSL